MTTFPDFEITSDYEFYCYLKARLPQPYRIVAEPSTKYYSEWMFHYRILKGDELIDECSGNYKEIEPGSLIKRANQLMAQLGGT